MMTTVCTFPVLPFRKILAEVGLDISIDGDTAVAFTEDVEKRFQAYGWQTLHVDNGDRCSTALIYAGPQLLMCGSSDLESIYNAIAEARKEKNKPTLIRLRTTIGFGSKQQGTHGVHGSRALVAVPDVMRTIPT